MKPIQFTFLIIFIQFLHTDMLTSHLNLDLIKIFKLYVENSAKFHDVPHYTTNSILITGFNGSILIFHIAVAILMAVNMNCSPLVTFVGNSEKAALELTLL